MQIIFNISVRNLFKQFVPTLFTNVRLKKTSLSVLNSAEVIKTYFLHILNAF